jgi:hypothetical protein
MAIALQVMEKESKLGTGEFVVNLIVIIIWRENRRAKAVVRGESGSQSWS